MGEWVRHKNKLLHTPGYISSRERERGGAEAATDRRVGNGNLCNIYLR